MANDSVFKECFVEVAELEADDLVVVQALEVPELLHHRTKTIELIWRNVERCLIVERIRGSPSILVLDELWLDEPRDSFCFFAFSVERHVLIDTSDLSWRIALLRGRRIHTSRR